MTLNEFFSLVPKAAVAFSGGTDSAFLLWAARECGCDVRAYYVKTPFQPQFELEDARRLASELAVPMTVVEADILAVPEAAANGPQRCYHCKTTLFSQLRQAAREDGYTVLLDGTNASDNAGDRPGMRALRELEVRSPLRECGLTKEEVRRRSREAGLFTWDKPAYACLATRIPTGTPITKEDLDRVERAECARVIISSSPQNITSCSPTIVPPRTACRPISLPRAPTAPSLPQMYGFLSSKAEFALSASISAVPLGASFFRLWCFSTISMSKLSPKNSAASFTSFTRRFTPTEKLAVRNTGIFFAHSSMYASCSAV